LAKSHIESSGSQLSLFSLFSTISLLWTQFWASVDTRWTPKWTPKSANQQRDLVYQTKQSFKGNDERNGKRGQVHA